MSVIVSVWLLIFGRDVGHCQHCQLQSLHGVCFGCSVFSQTDSKVFCIRLPATSMSGGCGQGSFWPNFAPKKEDDKSEADDMAVATQKSEELFENAAGQSENETPEEPEGEETPEVENKKPPRNSKKGAELLNAKPKAASSKAKAKAASSKTKAAPKKRVDPKRKAKAAPKRKSKQVKRPAAVDDLEASSEHEKAVDAESSEEIQEISGYGSDATATTLPLTPRAGTMQSERDSNKPKGRKPKDPKLEEVDKSSGCSKCRWSKRGCAKCRGQATK